MKFVKLALATLFVAMLISPLGTAFVFLFLLFSFPIWLPITWLLQAATKLRTKRKWKRLYRSLA